MAFSPCLSSRYRRSWLIRGGETQVGKLLGVHGYEVNDGELIKRLGPLLAHPDYRLRCARQEGDVKGLAVAMRIFGLQLAAPIVETTLLAVHPASPGRGAPRCRRDPFDACP